MPSRLDAVLRAGAACAPVGTINSTSATDAMESTPSAEPAQIEARADTTPLIEMVKRGAKLHDKEVWLGGPSQGYVTAAKMLLEHTRDDPNEARASDGQTALMIASASAYSQMMLALLEQPGIEVDKTDDMGRTALMQVLYDSINVLEAGHSGLRLRMAERLVKKGADPYRKDKSGRSFMKRGREVLKRVGDWDELEYLLREFQQQRSA